MNIFKIAHYYQIKLAMKGKETYDKLLWLQLHVNKIPVANPPVKNHQIINITILDLRNKVNSLVNNITQQYRIDSDELQSKINEIKNDIFKLQKLGYDKQVAASLALVEQVQIIDIDIEVTERHAYEKILLLQSEINKLPAGNDKLINITILNLRGRINNLVNYIKKNFHIDWKSLESRMNEIKNDILKLSKLGYDKQVAASLALAEQVQIMDIYLELAPETVARIAGKRALDR
jgi:hypothetical protein